MPNVNDLLGDVLALVGVASDETPSNADLQKVKRGINSMLDSWAARRLMVRSTSRESFAVQAGVGSYTIGVGATFNTAKPLAVTSAFLRDSNNNDWPLKLLTEAELDAIEDKSYSSVRPYGMCYDPGDAQQATQRGTVLFSSLPDAAYTLFMELQKPFTQLAALSDALTFEPMYYRAIKFNAAIEVYYEFRGHSKMIPPHISKLAADSMRVIETLNAKQVVADMDLPGQGRGRYNIYSDGNP